MVKGHDTLYGNVPDKSSVVLLLIDVINDLDFAGSDKLIRFALPMAKRLASLKERAKKHGCAAIYVNDNFGRWRSDFKSQVQHCLDDNVPGRKVVEFLHPEDDDYFVLKPAHSGFYSTALELLLKHLEAHTLILTGVSTNCACFLLQTMPSCEVTTSAFLGTVWPRIRRSYRETLWSTFERHLKPKCMIRERCPGQSGKGQSLVASELCVRRTTSKRYFSRKK
jgi:hypothetical protein